MNRFTVYVSSDEADALMRLAQSERRPTRDQAAILITEGLKRRGLLPADAPPTPEATHATQ